MHVRWNMCVCRLETKFLHRHWEDIRDCYIFSYRYWHMSTFATNPSHESHQTVCFSLNLNLLELVHFQLFSSHSVSLILSKVLVKPWKWFLHCPLREYGSPNELLAHSFWKPQPLPTGSTAPTHVRIDICMKRMDNKLAFTSSWSITQLKQYVSINLLHQSHCF